MLTPFTVRYTTNDGAFCESPVLDIHTIAGMAKPMLEGGTPLIAVRSFFLVAVPSGMRIIPTWLPADECLLCATARDKDGATTIYLE